MTRFRRMTSADISAVSRIGTETYPAAYYESDDSFASKILGFPRGAFVAERAGEIVGYAIGFPYILGESVPINSNYCATTQPTCYYVHDVCVTNAARGCGIGAVLADIVVISATLFPVALTAVLASAEFWRKRGFKEQRDVTYCALPAKYMVMA